MLTGHPPFYSTDRKKMFDDIKNRDVKFYDFHSVSAKDLLTKLLTKDPDQRLSSADEIKKHSFYAQIKWDELLSRKLTPPYKPVLKDPTDTSHFDAQQTGIPIASPPKYVNNELSSLYEE